jgi:site-specific DNA-methyltransferase (cytosine-N4-specific)
MSDLHLLWHEYRYFPYERMLGALEARSMFGANIEETGDGLVVKGSSANACGACRLTYFKAAKNGVLFVVPDQAKLEATGNGNRLASDSSGSSAPNLRRQSTRYSAHGLHEYRGKYNPQIVRAIGNLFDLTAGSWVYDPFCGSGTTLLEAAHIGWNAVGIDLNPLGVLIANAKITAFTTEPKVLERESHTLVQRIRAGANGQDWASHLPEPAYLEKWFPIPVLRQLRMIDAAIQQIKPKALQGVFRVILSDICREVSLQDPGDLRIRRRKDAAENYPATDMFIEATNVKISSIVRARQHIEPRTGTSQCACLGDTRDASNLISAVLKSKGQRLFDAAITSPPYATAMPYLDTQRLSLALLGLMSSKDLREGEKTLIGNREISNKERLALEARITSDVSLLPDAVVGFCRHLLERARDGTNGFRRRNVPALVYKYFHDMSCMFASALALIRTGGRYALLVGRNSTTLRGQEVLIDTPQMLAQIAESQGWSVEEMLPFETYQRYDVHKSNSIREEVLIVLRAP